MPRTIGSFNASWFSDPTLVPFEFVTMQFAAPTGTLHWTNWTSKTKPVPQTLTLDINDATGTHDWDTTRGFTIGQFEQGEQDVASISDVTFGNADNYFSDIMNLQPYGVRGVTIDVSYGGFTNTEPHTFIESVRYYKGVMNRAEVGEDVRVSILSFLNPMFPRRRFSTSHGFLWIPKQNLKRQWGTQIITLPTSNRPTVPPTGPGGGGGAPGDVGSNPTARGKPRTVAPRGSPPTAHGGRGIKPRKVTR